jgi:hypothetical protein
MRATPREELRDFLRRLLPQVPSGQFVLFWHLPSKRSEWVSEIDEAALDMLTASAEHEDVYVGCGLAPRNFGPRLRCPAEQVTGIPALWLDIDIKGVGHKKQNLPPDEAAAKALLAEMGIPPSAVVHSGHGLQAWWIFKEFWRIDSTAERAKAAALAKAWTDTLRAKARPHGWDIDATGDLARVMRLPGLWNRKDQAISTRLLSVTNTLYSRHELEEGCIGNVVQMISSSNASETEWQFTLRPDADAPAEKFHQLSEVDSLFRQSWQHARPDLQDQSPSAYDLALAHRAMAAGWSAQEIVNLLIAHRRKHGQDLKLRPDYYRRTLHTAARGRQAVEQERHVGTLREGGELPPEVLKDRAQCLAIVSRTLNCEITRLIRYQADPNEYEVEINKKLIPLGKVGTWTSQKSFRNVLCDAGAGWFVTQSGKAWDQVVRCLHASVEDVETGPEATERGATLAWLQHYRDQGVETEANWQRAIGEDAPAWKGAHMVFTSAGLLNFVLTYYHQRLNTQELAVRIRRIGCTSHPENVRARNGKRTTKGVWSWKPTDAEL